MVPKALSVPGVGSLAGKHPLFRALGPVTCYIGYQEGLGFATLHRDSRGRAHEREVK